MTTRYPNGITTAAKNQPLGEFILPDPSKVHMYFEDFNYFNTQDWTITTVEAGAGDATEALTDVDGGRLLITNDNADDDSNFFNKVGEFMSFEVGKKIWFDCLIRGNDIAQSDMIIGLQKTDTTPLNVSEGVFFITSDASTTVSLVVEKSNIATTTVVATMSDSTDTRLSYFFDGKDSIEIFAGGVHVATSDVTNMPDSGDILTISFGIQNGEASAKNMTIDYIMAAKER